MPIFPEIPRADIRSFHGRLLNAGFRGNAYVQDSGDHRLGFFVIRFFITAILTLFCLLSI